MSTSRLGCIRPVQEDLGAGIVSHDERVRPEHVVGEAAHHLGEPVDRVGVAGAVLGVAVQREVGYHEPVALGEALGDGLPLAVGEQAGVQQRERRAGADLAIGDARAVGVVVEAKPHGECLAHDHASIVRTWEGASGPKSPRGERERRASPSHLLCVQARSQDAPRVARVAGALLKAQQSSI